MGFPQSLKHKLLCSVIEDLNTKWQKEIETMRRDFSNNVLEIKNEAEREVTHAKLVAAKASDEWNSIEYDLKNNREEVRKTPEAYPCIHARLIAHSQLTH